MSPRQASARPVLRVKRHHLQPRCSACCCRSWVRNLRTLSRHCGPRRNPLVWAGKIPAWRGAWGHGKSPGWVPGPRPQGSWNASLCSGLGSFGIVAGTWSPAGRTRAASRSREEPRQFVWPRVVHGSVASLTRFTPPGSMWLEAQQAQRSFLAQMSRFHPAVST